MGRRSRARTGGGGARLGGGDAAGAALDALCALGGGGGAQAAAAARSALAALYAAAAPLVPARRGAEAPLAKLHVEGFDAEQIWVQLERQNAPAVRALGKRLAKAARAADEPESLLRAPTAPAAPSKAAGRKNKGKKARAARQAGARAEGAAEGEEDSEEEEARLAALLDEEMGEEASEGDEDEEGARQRPSASAVELKPAKRRHAMETDRFFRLNDLESLLDEAEADEFDKGSEGEEDGEDDEWGDLYGGAGGGDGEGEEEDDYDADLREAFAATAAAAGATTLGLGGGGGGDGDGEDSRADYTYEEFFGRKRGGKAAGGGKGEGEVEGAGDDEGDLGDLAEEESASSDEDESDDAESESESDEDLDARVMEHEAEEAAGRGGVGDAEAQEALETAHQRRAAKLAKRIAELEDKALKDAHWSMKGEVNAKKRPKNSLLEAELDYDRGVAPAPAPTEEAAAELEEMVKRRIGTREFDDVEWKARDDGGRVARTTLELDEEKSGAGLGELYEADYQRRAAGAPSAAATGEEEARAEAERVFATLCDRLDRLSRTHYTPKLVHEEMQVKADAPALQLEEAIPEVMTAAGMLAPQDVYKSEGGHGAAGAAVAEVELTHEDRRRRRAANKRKLRAELGKGGDDEGQRLEGAVKVTRLDKEGKALAAGGKKARRAAAAQADATAAAGARGARSELTKSDAFFSHLQDVVDMDRNGGAAARRAKKAEEDAENRPKASSYRLM